MYNQSQKFNNIREKIGCINGSYMNSSGNLVISNPFETRMNYKYSSGSLVFDQELVESTKKNYYTANSITGDVSLYNGEYLIPGVDVWYSSTGNVLLDQNYTSDFSSMASSTNFTTSFFIKKVGGTSSEVNFTRRWYWAPGLIVNLDTGEVVSGQSPGMIFQSYGNGWYRIGGWMCGHETVANRACSLVNRVNTSDDIEFLVTCNMCEELDSTNTITSGSDTYYWPSSWIPYECTRMVFQNGILSEPLV